MSLYFGIAIKESCTGIITAASLAAYQSMEKPPFNSRLPYTEIKNTFQALAIVRNITVEKAINAACHRTIEQLVYKKLLDPNGKIDTKLLMRPEYRNVQVDFPVAPTSKHWLLNAVDNALYLWLRGAR